MTDLLTVMATPAWAYLALYGLLVVDAMVPVVPIQAVMITSGALTVYGGLNLPLVIAVGALGMFTGDTICYVLGRTAGQSSGPGISRRLAALRQRFAPKHDHSDEAPSAHRASAKRAAARFTRGLRRPGPLVLLLCRFVPGGRMAAGYYAGRTGYPVRLFLLYDGSAALGWATYGGLVGHIGGTALTQSAWRLFAVAATAAVIFGTAGWVLALFGGRHETHTATGSPADPIERADDPAEAPAQPDVEPEAGAAGPGEAAKLGSGKATAQRTEGSDGAGRGAPAAPRPSGVRR